jgi:hypothetical protein
MICNFFENNLKKIEEIKNDPLDSFLTDIRSIPKVVCKIGVGAYEPTEDEIYDYCTTEFMHCPKFQQSIMKKSK